MGHPLDGFLFSQIPFNYFISIEIIEKHMRLNEFPNTANVNCRIAEIKVPVKSRVKDMCLLGLVLQIALHIVLILFLHTYSLLFSAEKDNLWKWKANTIPNTKHGSL